MKPSVAVIGLVALALPGRSFAHRLDEYLQATTISVEKDRIVVGMRLSPGVAVAPFIIPTIDRNRDGVISSVEEAAYIEQVRHDVTLTLGNKALSLRPVSKEFATVKDMQDGTGESLIEFVADVPRNSDLTNELIFENHHQSQVSAFLVNAIVPSDPNIRITGQDRNFEQSSYRLDYSRTVSQPVRWSLASWNNQRTWLILLALLVMTRVVFLKARRVS